MANQVNASETLERLMSPSGLQTSDLHKKAYIFWAIISRNSTFTESDLFRNDQITTLRDQYLRWQLNSAEDLVANDSRDTDPTFDRIVAAASRLDALKREEIGSIPLEMAYLFLFTYYRQYKLFNDTASLRHASVYDAVLH